MEIKINVGVGPIEFGMSPDEVKSAVGTDPVYEDWMGGNLNDSLYFPGVIVIFDQYDSVGPLEAGKVVSFVMNPSNYIHLNGTPLAEFTVAQIMKIKIDGFGAELDLYNNADFLGLGLNFGINNKENKFIELSMNKPETHNKNSNTTQKEAHVL